MRVPVPIFSDPKFFTHFFRTLAGLVTGSTAESRLNVDCAVGDGKQDTPDLIVVASLRVLTHGPLARR